MSEGFESQYSIHQAASCSDSYFFFTLIKENFFFSKNQFSVPETIFPWQSKVIIFQRPIFNCQKKVFFLLSFSQQCQRGVFASLFCCNSIVLNWRKNFCNNQFFYYFEFINFSIWKSCATLIFLSETECRTGIRRRFCLENFFSWEIFFTLRFSLDFLDFFLWFQVEKRFLFKLSKYLRHKIQILN